MLAQGGGQLWAQLKIAQTRTTRLAQADQRAEPVLGHEHTAQFGWIVAQLLELLVARSQMGGDQLGLAAEVADLLMETELLCCCGRWALGSFDHWWFLGLHPRRWVAESPKNRQPSGCDHKHAEKNGERGALLPSLGLLLV